MGDAAREFKVNGASVWRIVPQLREDILSGSLAAGQPLRQDELAAKFNVSKVPLREALRQLEADGLVEFRPRRGAFVVELTADDFAEMFDIRVALECRALELAVPNLVEADLRFAREILNDYAARENYEEWSDLNLRFHLALYEPCNRYQLIRMIRQLHEKTGLFRRLRITMVSGLERPHREHEELLNVCAKGDVGGAVTILRGHIETSQKEVAAHFRRQSLRVADHGGRN